jgi:hypothetical protein
VSSGGNESVVRIERKRGRTRVESVMWSEGFGCLQREAERKRVGGRSFVAAGKVSKLGLGINSFHAALKTD